MSNEKNKTITLTDEEHNFLVDELGENRARSQELLDDEIISIGSNVDCDKTLDKILAIMKTPPSWCSDLPLDAEGGYSQRYDK